ncbi:Triacylglycerol lipase [Nesidiocoris tenuis]|uniref:Triacylglycerol lipase n=1 Tax=Nesidiocoris tenuis TaxID=355587 RepID=A0ABN7B822_9HEMI|nr:Triacylglycerol lipase [Nesidiocoris tenuis]
MVRDRIFLLVASLLVTAASVSAQTVQQPNKESWKNNLIDVNMPWFPQSAEVKCYDELGCLNLTKEWYHIINRAFNVFPLRRDLIDTKFHLYTRANALEAQLLKCQDPKTIERSNFDSKRLTKFIIHGFIDTPLSSWIKEMRLALLKHRDYNVIVVDWAGGSLPLYTQATANTRLVGLEIAYLINYLKDNHGLKPEQVHLIGHSLGAHTAGYAGERVPGLGRITGLDPAEPYFHGMPPMVRLDPTDAELVDVIHTDATSILLMGYGMVEPVGHLDFYPNNGKAQPGCDITENPLPLTLVRQGIEEASRVLVACNHIRAIKLFIESINGHCPYLGYRCSSYNAFTQGKCFSCGVNGTNCAVMGFHAEKMPGVTPGGKYYISTGKDTPFCRHHYRVTIDLAKPQKAEAWVQGFMRVSLHSDNGVIKNLDLTPNGYEKLEHGTSKSFVVTHTEDIGPVKRVEFYWEYDMNVLQPRSICFLWCNDHLYIRDIKVTKSKINSRSKRGIDVSSKLCTPGRREFTDIASRSTALFLDDCEEG